MKKIIASLALWLITLISNGQSTTISSEPFNKIHVSSSARIELKVDSTYSITYDDNHPNTKGNTVSNGVLTISSSDENDLIIRMPNISEVIMDGEGTVKSMDTLKAETLQLQMRGAGKIDLKVDAQKVNADIQGMGKIVLSGTAQEANFSIPGAGKIDASELRTVTCNANISGLGKCIVNPIDVLNATITGNGTIVYNNTPKELNKNITGLGTVKNGSGNSDTSSSSSSQTTGEKDTTKVDLGKKQLWIIGDKNPDKPHKKTIKPIWAGFELGVNTYMDNGGTFTLSESKKNFDLEVDNSIYVSLNLIQKSAELGHSNIHVLTGLGITWNNYRFDSDIILDNGNVTTAAHDTSDINHIKSKLVATYLTAPVMFEVFTSRKKKDAFHLGIGGMFGLRIASYTKRKFEENGQTVKVHSHDDFNLSTFRYGFRVAVGYGNFNVFADYYASTLFKENKGPVLFPVTAGITMVGF